MNHLPPEHSVAVRTGTSRGGPAQLVVHDHATVALHLAGEPGELWMHGRYEVRTGDLVLVPATMPHAASGASGTRWRMVSICLSCLQSDARAPLVALFDEVRRGGCAVRRLDAEEQRGVLRVMDDLERELGGEGAGRALAVGAHLSLLAVAIQRATPPEVRPVGASPVVAEALAFVDRHATDGISLRDVAQHVARSPAYVTSLVKGETGDTVVGWITRARMSAGRQLLLHTDQTVEQVAERCGFASPSHFHRAFKRAHRTTPNEWRREHRG